MNASDECNITEIEVLPDGRVCVFGTSAEVLSVLQELRPDTAAVLEQRLQIRLDCQATQPAQAKPAVPKINSVKEMP